MIVSVKRDHFTLNIIFTLLIPVQAFVGESPVAPALFPGQNQQPHPPNFPLCPRSFSKEPSLERLPTTDRHHHPNRTQAYVTHSDIHASSEGHKIRARRTDFTASHGTVGTAGRGCTVLAASQWALGY